MYVSTIQLFLKIGNLALFFRTVGKIWQRHTSFSYYFQRFIENNNSLYTGCKCMNRWKFIKNPPSSRNFKLHFLYIFYELLHNLCIICIKSALKLIGSRQVILSINIYAYLCIYFKMNRQLHLYLGRLCIFSAINSVSTIYQ